MVKKKRSLNYPKTYKRRTKRRTNRTKRTKRITKRITKKRKVGKRRMKKTRRTTKQRGGTPLPQLNDKQVRKTIEGICGGQLASELSESPSHKVIELNTIIRELDQSGIDYKHGFVLQNINDLINKKLEGMAVEAEAKAEEAKAKAGEAVAAHLAVEASQARALAKAGLLILTYHNTEPGETLNSKPLYGWGWGDTPLMQYVKEEMIKMVQPDEPVEPKAG